MTIAISVTDAPGFLTDTPTQVQGVLAVSSAPGLEIN